MLGLKGLANPSNWPLRNALRTVSPYQTAMSAAMAAKLAGRSDFSRLGNSENLYGPSSRVAWAVGEALVHPEYYPDPQSESLRQALSLRLNVDMARIVVTPGSEALIDYVIRSAISPKDTFLQSSPTFPTFEIFARCAEAKIVDVPRVAGFKIDLDAFCQQAAKGPRMMALCTPNNPTGNAMTAEELRTILQHTPKSTLVLLDEAYREYHEAFDTLGMLDAWGGSYVSSRTFSKAYGLAGLRVGYGIASSPDVISAIDRLRPPFNITSVSQAAALAAWQDTEHLQRTVAMTRRERKRVEQALDDLGIERVQTEANFVFARSPIPLDVAFNRLLSQGLIVRPEPVRDGWLRINIGRAADNDRLIESLPSILP